MKLSEDTILADRYRISRLLGQGGMGAVYLASDLRFRDAPVAVKQTLVGGHREDLRRAFQREAMLLNHLRHPALPRVTDFFGQEDSEFLVMEFVPGEDLGAELVRRGMPFPVEKVALWTDRLLDALAYLHSQTPPVIHRDIKPQNVKLTPDGDIVLLDFGLAKGSVGEQLTTTSSVVAGSPFFAPPEQMGGHGTDERADLYSLAATTYRLLTAVLPPDANHRSTCFINGMDDPLRPAHLLNPGVPPALSLLLSRALSLKKDDRPASAVAMRGLWRDAIRESLPDVAHDLTLMKQYGSSDSGDTQVEPPLGSTVVESTTDRSQEAVTSRPNALDRLAPADHTRTLVAGDATNVSSHASGQLGTLTVPTRRTDARLALLALLAVGVVVLGIWRIWFAGGEGSSTYESRGTVSSVPAPVGATSEPDVDLGDGIRIEMLQIPAGGFYMGSNTGDADEKPVHLVMISTPFLVGKYEVTQGQWKAVMGSAPSRFTGSDQLPVEQVSWDDCQEFIRRLNSKTGMEFRLPTEAEWECACRAGTSSDFAGNLHSIGWYYENAGRRRLSDASWDLNKATSNGNQTHPVGQKQPNGWGLYDMHGNVSEWCQDWYDENYYGRSPGTDPVGSVEGSRRVQRGGTWWDDAVLCRSARRYGNPPGLRSPVIGFRLARTQ